MSKWRPTNRKTSSEICNRALEVAFHVPHIRSRGVRSGDLAIGVQPEAPGRCNMRSYTVLSKLASWSIRYFLFSTPIALRKGLVWAQRCLFYTYKFLQKKILFSNVPKLLSSSTSISNNNNNSDSLQFLNFETFRWYPPLHSFGLVPSRYFFLIVPLSDVLRYHHCHDLFSFSNFFIQVSLLLHFLLHIWGVLLEDGTGTTALDLCSSPTFVGKLHVWRFPRRTGLRCIMSRPKSIQRG